MAPLRGQKALGADMLKYLSSDVLEGRGMGPKGMGPSNCEHFRIFKILIGSPCVLHMTSFGRETIPAITEMACKPSDEIQMN